MKIIFLLPIFMLISCNSQYSGDKDIKLNPNTGDTLEIIKRYSTNKTKEVIYFKNNRPDSNICFTEQGDTIDFPKLLYIKESDSLFLFIPIKRHFSTIELLYSKEDSLITYSNTPSVHEPFLRQEGFTKSIDLPLNKVLIYNKMVKGAIKLKKPNEEYEFYPFELTIE